MITIGTFNSNGTSTIPEDTDILVGQEFNDLENNNNSRKTSAPIKNIIKGCKVLNKSEFRQQLLRFFSSAPNQVEIKTYIPPIINLGKWLYESTNKEISPELIHWLSRRYDKIDKLEFNLSIDDILISDKTNSSIQALRGLLIWAIIKKCNPVKYIKYKEQYFPNSSIKKLKESIDFLEPFFTVLTGHHYVLQGIHNNISVIGCHLKPFISKENINTVALLQILILRNWKFLLKAYKKTKSTILAGDLNIDTNSIEFSILTALKPIKKMQEFGISPVSIFGSFLCQDSFFGCPQFKLTAPLNSISMAEKYHTTSTISFITREKYQGWIDHILLLHKPDDKLKIKLNYIENEYLPKNTNRIIPDELWNYSDHVFVKAILEFYN